MKFHCENQLPYLKIYGIFKNSFNSVKYFFTKTINKDGYYDPILKIKNFTINEDSFLKNISEKKNFRSTVKIIQRINNSKQHIRFFFLKLFLQCEADTNP